MAYLLKRISRETYWVPTYLTRTLSSFPMPLRYSEEVLKAKKERGPIVALESTIITHGMPYPHNFDTAIEVENIIRRRGATPATVAILKGQMTVGLSEAQLQYLAQAQGVVKASRRDLAPVVAAMADGATTVAGTIIAAELADIPVFVTGGIGGVHQDGQDSLDVSADLTELGRSRTMVVCSGVKSILDIGRTLEYLETQGVSVCAFGDTDNFPSFYTPRSGHRAPYRMPTAEHAARLLHASRALQLQSGIIIAVPVPPAHAMDEAEIDDAIKFAMEDAAKKGIRGKEVTPFILAAVAKVTKGKSLAANIALIKNNAQVGADIAVEFKKLNNFEYLGNASNKGFSKAKTPHGARRQYHTSSHMLCRGKNEQNGHTMLTERKSEGDVLVIGGSNVDRTYKVTEKNIQMDGSTHPCITSVCGGGVGRNMAEALWQMRDHRVRLLTAIGDDADGRYLVDIASGLILDGCIVQGARTPTYATLLDARGECVLGLGDMTLHDSISKEFVNKQTHVLQKAPLIVLDGNAPQTTIDHVLELCQQYNKPVFYEPTDRRKAVKALQKRYRVTYASPNLAELKAMAAYLEPASDIKSVLEISDILELAKIVTQVVDNLVVTLGSKGVLVTRRVNKKESNSKWYPAQIVNSVLNVSGAGDCFASGFIHGILSGLSEAECVSVGFESAKRAMRCHNTVPILDNITVTSSH